jgi:ABC-2 type transport system permease protein
MRVRLYYGRRHNMMQKMWALYKKELKIFFSMPVAYVVMTVYMVLSGYFFANIVNYYAMISLRSMNNQYQRAQMDLSIIEGVFRPYFHNVVIVLILMIPLITMRLFAEEKREGTSELLFTYPVNDFTIVSAKFLSALTVYASMLIGTISCFIMMRVITAYELLPALSGLLGLLLIGAAFIALGIFISTLTESQIVAAVISFGVLLLFIVLPWMAQAVGPGLGRIINELSIVEHFDGFAKGVVDTADLIYMVNFTVLFFFLTLRVLESKQWRG